MFVTLGTSPRPAPTATGPALKLLECHERIRRMSSLAVALATTDAPDKEVVEVAERLRRYFTLAMPLHAADEDLSVTPALLAVSPSRPVVEALHRIGREHVEADDLIDQLSGAWDVLTQEPARRSAMALLPTSARLQTLMRAHLEVEEAHIIPAVAVLPPEVQARLVSEFQARRG